ncbi:hypothetical protein OIU79_001565 [Salix purpurea]|uniref:RNase H type-1 domain-containing protein n=1 Tax=Salix purpurea TaxID=77065 RepID=A0A9Q0UQP1_SALPP|nr:hypothetical protein OIU79_001565 [Salix purpurea]
MFGFSSRVQSGSAFEAELVAVREALKLAWDKGLRRVILESDSESVVNRIRAANQSTQESAGGDHTGMSGLWQSGMHGIASSSILAGKATSLRTHMIGMEVPRHGALDKNQIGHLKVLKRELLARNLHWY